MAFKDVLVHIDASASGKSRFVLAADLAARHGARITALYVREHSIAQLQRLRSSELGLVSSAQKENLDRELHDEMDANASSIHEWIVDVSAARGVDIEWRDVEGHAKSVVPQHARYANITIVGHDTATHANLPDEYSFAEMMLFTIGRPLILVPSVHKAGCDLSSLGRHVAVAWNGSRPSARSLSDAVPMIEMADKVTVFFGEDKRARHRDSLSTDQIQPHLERHARKVEGVRFEPDRRSIGVALQEAAIQVGADVLVAGAHGRPSLWGKNAR
jgi:nucleotide-binding universal stress UspA family protein